MAHNNGENITFAGGQLDRAAHMRHQATALLQADGALTLLLWQGKPLIETRDAMRLAWLPVDHALAQFATEGAVFLGLIDGKPRFAMDVSAWVDPNDDTESRAQFLDASQNHHPALPVGQNFIELRAAMGELSDDDAGDAATAKSILGWHENHQFCAKCGARSQIKQGGWQRNCTACNAAHFPRTDPVVIMLVTYGNNILLGRSPHFPPGMYSLLAGFVEPGESLETAVRREVAEETTVPIGHVRYLASQPWPFPASLMIGCHAEALSQTITIDPHEIEAAMWISRERLALALAGQDPEILPARRGSIAHALMRAWVKDTLDEPF